VRRPTKPWGRIVQKTGDHRRIAVVTAGVEDEHGLDLALAPFRDRIAANAPTGFAIRLTSRLTYEEIFDAMERAGGKCNCEGGESGVSLPGSIAVGLGWHNNQESWSDRVAARLHFLWSYGPEDGVFVFDCHSVYSGLFERRTDCESKTSCAKPLECMCNDDRKRWRFWCEGWHLCICHNPKVP